MTHSPNLGRNYAFPRYDEEDPEDDSLGYYDDGVKRTLTDEQIEIFRHSEIQALLRERRLKAEREAEQDTEASLSGSYEKDDDDDDAGGNGNPAVDDITSMPQTQHDYREKDADRNSTANGEIPTHLDPKPKAKQPDAGESNGREQEQHAANRTPQVYTRRIITYGD